MHKASPAQRPFEVSSFEGSSPFFERIRCDIKSYNLAVDYLRLARTRSISSKRFHALVNSSPNIQSAIEQAPLRIKKASGEDLTVLSVSDAKKELDALLNYDAEVIFSFDSCYPELLKEVPDCPPVLTVKGNLKVLNLKNVALVGSRSASANGLKFTHILASDIAKGGYCITSGLARGVDTVAHKASLKHGTMAVMASGINVVYPSENAALFEQIISSDGAVLTELPFNSAPKEQFFPQRNRIIAGMSYGTVVVEAHVRSGSLITANFAEKYSRSVFAVPGSPLDSRSSGVNWLIKKGATVVENAKDILVELEDVVMIREKQRQKDLFTPIGVDKAKESDVKFYDQIVSDIPTEQELDDVRDKIISMLNYNRTTLDEIYMMSGVSINKIARIILELELIEKLERYPDGSFALMFQ